MNCPYCMKKYGKAREIFILSAFCLVFMPNPVIFSSFVQTLANSRKCLQDKVCLTL